MRIRRLLLLFAFAVSAPLALPAQYKVRIVLKEQTVVLHDSIYVTGSFSNWDSTPNPRYRLQPLQGGEKVVVLNVPAGRLEYKFHRGSWQTVEKNYYGWEVANRVVTITGNATFVDSVACWRDEILKDKWLALGRAMPDTERIRLFTSLATVYNTGSNEYYNIDSALYYSGQTLLQLQKIKASDVARPGKGSPYAQYLFNAQEVAAGLVNSLGNYTKSLELRLNNLKLAEEQSDTAMLFSSLEGIANTYAAMKDYQSELAYGNRLLALGEACSRAKKPYALYVEGSAGLFRTEALYNLGKQDSALYYGKRLLALAKQVNFLPGLAQVSFRLGTIYAAKDSLAKARAYFLQAADYGNRTFLFPVVVRSQAGLARLFQRLGRTDSAFVYAKAAFAGLQQRANIQTWGESTEALTAEVSPLLADLYQQSGRPDSAYKYLQLSVAMKDSLYNLDKLRQFQNIGFNETLRQQQQQQEEKAARRQYENRIKFTLLGGGLLALLVVAFLLYRNNRQKQKANLLLQKTNAAVEEQRAKAEDALRGLQAAQAQLVQQEKMASLGELTAGIAHEIQNPLNFVNNFAEVNAELLEELKRALLSGSNHEAIGLADEIKENEAKISRHGKRADGIVKGMLQHARASTGQKEPTDINKLADEYLRLSYQGMRAKDNSFNAAIEKSFDGTVGSINVVPQEIGRVLLNLFNNAFYAVNEKKKQLNDAYTPLVAVTTRKDGGKVIVTVKDNGTGIPQKVADKIFQPFFTTKPTGEGTGLGLSLSYDVVTKGHGGTLTVQSKAGEGSEFVVVLSVA